MFVFHFRQILILHADCAQKYQLQPLLAGCLLSWSVPPAPEVSPLPPLVELPAPGFSPLQALALGEQPLIAKVDPAIRPAMQKPARIFFRSFTSIIASCNVKDEIHIYPLGWELEKRIVEMEF
jgi:hypothetical protein